MSRLESISREECLAILASRSVGRVAFVTDKHPVVFPVNYQIDGDVIVFRTSAGTALVESSLTHVAFEIDDIDIEARGGWSVLVQGVAQEITEALDTRSERLLALPVEPWPSGPRHRWMRILPRSITGRRLVSDAEAGGPAPAG